MRRLVLIFCGGIVGLTLLAAAQSATAQTLAPDSGGKNCRMEQQCHWKDFKKYCVWVKVCRSAGILPG